MSKENITLENGLIQDLNGHTLFRLVFGYGDDPIMAFIFADEEPTENDIKNVIAEKEIDENDFPFNFYDAVYVEEM